MSDQMFETKYWDIRKSYYGFEATKIKNQSFKSLTVGGLKDHQITSVALHYWCGIKVTVFAVYAIATLPLLDNTS